MPQPKVNIAGSSGDLVGVTDNRLDVNTTLGVGTSTFTTYTQDTATTSAQTITTLIGEAVTTCKEIIIQADFDNASFIMIGDGQDTADDTEGIRLQAGDMLTLPVSSTANVSISAPDGSQKLNISIIT
tara:strand:- start:1062 stop:1445 length:384 start_codon:yes stop_codon:yes gene_type:complete